MQTIKIGRKRFEIDNDFKKKDNEDLSDEQIRGKVLAYSKPDKTGCWMWLNFLDGNGYGQLRINYKIQSAHKASYQAFIGKVPIGKELHHECEHRSCVNPMHLTPLTRTEHQIKHSMNVDFKEFEKRFLQKINIKRAKDCWPWLGPILPNGSSICRDINKSGLGMDNTTFTTPQRVMWRFRIDKPMPRRIEKTCTNKLCVNPRHFIF